MRILFSQYSTLDSTDRHRQTGDQLLIDLSQKPVAQLASRHPEPSPEKKNILMIPKKGILLLTNLQTRTTKLVIPYRLATHSLSSIHQPPPDKTGRATHLRNQNLITRRNAHRNPLAITIKQARADGKDFRLVLLLDGCFGEEDARGGFGFGFYALDEDAVEEGGEAFDVADEGLWFVSWGSGVGGGVRGLRVPF